MLAPLRSTFEAVCNEFEHVEQKLPKLFIKPIQHIHLDGKSILYISSLKKYLLIKTFHDQRKISLYTIKSSDNLICFLEYI